MHFGQRLPSRIDPARCTRMPVRRHRGAPRRRGRGAPNRKSRVTPARTRRRGVPAAIDGPPVVRRRRRSRGRPPAGTGARLRGAAPSARERGPAASCRAGARAGGVHAGRGRASARRPDPAGGARAGGSWRRRRSVGSRRGRDSGIAARRGSSSTPTTWRSASWCSRDDLADPGGPLRRGSTGRAGRWADVCGGASLALGARCGRVSAGGAAHRSGEPGRSGANVPARAGLPRGGHVGRNARSADGGSPERRAGPDAAGGAGRHELGRRRFSRAERCAIYRGRRPGSGGSCCGRSERGRRAGCGASRALARAGDRLVHDAAGGPASGGRRRRCPACGRRWRVCRCT